MIKQTIATLCLLFAAVSAMAQNSSPISVTATSRRQNDSTVEILISARLHPGDKLYSVHKVSDDAPYSTLSFDSTLASLLLDSIREEGALKNEQSPDFKGLDLPYYQDSVLWIQNLRLDAHKKEVVDGKLTWLLKVGNQYQPGESDFTVVVPATAFQASAGPLAGPGSLAGKSLWFILIAGFLAGIAAFISPCIYAMLPVTVSFFTKRSGTRAQGIRNAVYYALSIVSIFTLLGFLITLIFGPGALNNLASSAVFNILVFLLFAIFGISFLGAFEINLPSGLATRVDSKANAQSFAGIFFMALTLVVVSFSCTVPFIGGLAVLTAKGGKAAPLVGFFGFSLALALPFALFAFFPAWLNKLARSGGWLNAVKVALGFVELALAMKFLSSADLAYHWHILDREVYLSIWIVLAGLLGLYLLGKLRFSHDSDLPVNDLGQPYLSVTRLGFAIAALSFMVYMIPGLWGAPLNGISAWIPEMKTQDFNLTRTATVTVSFASTDSTLVPHKYTNFLESEIHGVTTFFDYDEAIAAARKEHRPLMIDFTGHSCANCRKMERAVLNDPAVIKELQDHFVLASLYVDDKYRLPDEEWYTSKNDGGAIREMGSKNLDFEVTLTQNSSQPQYVFVNQDGKVIENAGGYNPDIQRFLAILKDVGARYAQP